MASPRIEYAVLPAGDGPGQDRCFTAEGLVVVLDGASAIDPEANPDATEYVDTLGPLLIEQITGTPGIDLRDALAETIRQTADKLALVPGTAPSSTVSIVRWGDEIVEVLVLGDSAVLVQFVDGHEETIVQHSQDRIASDLRKRYRDRLARGYGYDSKHRELLAEIQRNEAQFRNKDGGFWIAEALPAAAYEATSSASNTMSVTCCIIYTDGVEAGDVTAVASAGSGDSVADFLETMHRYEEVCDPRGMMRPRSKKHDDKAIALMRTGRNSND